MATRFFTSKDRKSIRYGMVISCIWVFIVSFCAWFNGAVGRGLSPNSTVELQNWAASFGATGNEWREYVMPWMLVEQNILPLAFTALFLAAVTAKGIAKDKELSDERTLFWTRISIIIIVAIAILLTFIRPAFILDLCMFSWAALNAFTLVPYVAGLFWKGGTKKAAFISGIIALCVAIGWFFCFNSKLTVPGLPLLPDIGSIVLVSEPVKITINSIHEFLVSQAVAIPAFFIISLLDKKKPDKKFLDDLFEYIKEDTNE